MSEDKNNTPPKKANSKRFFKRYFALILLTLVVLLALSSYYFYKKSNGNIDKVNQSEVKSLVQKVGKLVVLPEEETPTIATVSDPEALKGQAFFVDAKKGDKVLIYSKSQKAILYDPVLKKVVNIAPINIDTKTKKETSTSTVDSSKNKN